MGEASECEAIRSVRFVALRGVVVVPRRETTQEVGASQAAEERGVTDQIPWSGGLCSGCHDHADQKGCNGDQAQAESCNSEVEDALLSRRPGRPCHHLRSYSTHLCSSRLEDAAVGGEDGERGRAGDVGTYGRRLHLHDR